MEIFKYRLHVFDFFRLLLMETNSYTYLFGPTY